MAARESRESPETLRPHHTRRGERVSLETRLCEARPQYWSNGGDAWISSRGFTDRPDPSWRWFEGDDPRVRWSQFPQFFGMFAYDGVVESAGRVSPFGEKRGQPAAPHLALVADGYTDGATVSWHRRGMSRGPVARRVRCSDKPKLMSSRGTSGPRRVRRAAAGRRANAHAEPSCRFNCRGIPTKCLLSSQPCHRRQHSLHDAV